MRVLAFAPSLEATEQDGGGLALRGFPMTSAYVDTFPVEITVPVVVAVVAGSGGEYHPVRNIVATAPDGQRLATVQFGWEWPDVPDIPIKFRVFVQHVPLILPTPGTYTFTLCEDPDAPSDDVCYLPVVRNPFVDVPDQ